MDAAVLLSKPDFDRRRARGHPMQLIKDTLQLRCLCAFGGWFADLDIAWLREGLWEDPADWAQASAGVLRRSQGSLRVVVPGDPSCPALPSPAALFFSQLEREGDAFAKQGAKRFTFGDRLASLNLGLVWGARGALVLEEASKRLAEVEVDMDRQWASAVARAKPRLCRDWLANQLALQELLVGRSDARLADPAVAFPFPRVLLRCPFDRDTQHGIRVAPVHIATAQSAAVCLWTGVWSPPLSAQILNLSQQARRAQSEVAGEAGHGASCGAPFGASATSSGSLPAPQQAVELLVETLSVLQRGGLAAFQMAGADLVLAHTALASALGLACQSMPHGFAGGRWGAQPMAYGFLCLAAKLHWPRVDEANGLGSLAFVWESWGALLQVLPDDRQQVRAWCETVCISGPAA
jgi:hypothetical protein